MLNRREFIGGVFGGLVACALGTSAGFNNVKNSAQFDADEEEAYARDEVSRLMEERNAVVIYHFSCNYSYSTNPNCTFKSCSSTSFRPEHIRKGTCNGEIPLNSLDVIKTRLLGIAQKYFKNYNTLMMNIKGDGVESIITRNSNYVDFI